MLTANNPLLARLAENHTQMLMAHNQLAEAHKMLISQLVGQFENDPSDPNEPTRASKPKPFAPDVKPQPVAPSAIVEPQEAIEPAPVVEVRTKTEDKSASVDIESLDLRHVVALSVLFGDKALKPDNTQLASARAMFASEKADSVTGQIDALYCALNGVAQLQRFPKAKILTICLKTLANWDNISGITERREFALSLVRELPTPAEVKPTDFKALRSEASACITQLVKGGYRNEALDILAAFNAKKMGDVTDDNLVQFIEKAQCVLAEDNAKGSDG